MVAILEINYGYQFIKNNMTLTQTKAKMIEKMRKSKWLHGMRLSGSQAEYIEANVIAALDEYAKAVVEEVKNDVSRIKLDMDVVVCDCGEPYRDSDVAGYVDELDQKLNQKHNEVIESLQ